jgi:hypothetical protein
MRLTRAPKRRRGLRRIVERALIRGREADDLRFNS